MRDESRIGHVLRLISAMHSARLRPAGSLNKFHYIVYCTVVLSVLLPYSQTCSECHTS